jgi:hypothetical protein
LPQDKEAERIRVETAQRISGETEKHWDDAGSMDLRTKNLLGFAGVQCRIIGTFYLEENTTNSEAPKNLKFGSDISNYYPNRGLKVYKPNAKALEEIIATLQAYRLILKNTATRKGSNLAMFVMLQQIENISK